MNKKLLLFLSSLLLIAVLVPIFSYTPAINAAAKAFLLTTILDTPISSLPQLAPDNALVMHPTFIPKRNEVSKQVRASIDDFDDYFFSKDFPLSLDDTDKSLMKPFRSFRPFLQNIPIDIKDTGKAYEIIADIPGVTKEGTKVEIDDGVLIITAERSTYQKTGNDKDDETGYLRVERSQGMTKRTITLPSDADNEKVQASFDNGVLTVKVQKLPSAAKKQTVKSIPVK